MNDPDVRWQQRLDNYGRALKQLRAALALVERITQRHTALFESFAIRMEGLRRG